MLNGNDRGLCASMGRIRRFALVGLPMLAMSAGTAMAAGWHGTATSAFDTGVAVRTGSLEGARSLHIVVSLKLRNKSELDGMVSRIMDRNDAMFGRALRHEQVAQSYLPTSAQAAAVAQYLQQHGATHVAVSASRLLVSADMSVANIRSAFNTDLARFNDNGREVFANTRGVSVPDRLKDAVLAVHGLQNVEQYHTMLVRADAAPAAAGGFNPTAFPKAYGVSSAATGSNTAVAIITDGNVTQTKTDLSTFESNNGISPVTVVVKGPGGSDTSGVIEWDLDSQDIVAMSGGVKQLILYDAASLTDSALATDYDLVLSDNLAKGINVSLGECERSAKSSGAMATDDQIFEAAAAQGQTFFVSSGDSNSRECFYGFEKGDSYPASSPYVVSVGGTALKVTSSGTYSSETVWDTSYREGTGGGPSLYEPKPSWQSGVSGITQNTRGVPDISLDADPATGALITYKGSSTQVGGTSLAAPLATGLWARAQTTHGNALGFGASLIYGLPSSDFHDVTSGNNNGYSAGSGWDYCTGFGSPVGDAYINAL